MSHIFIYFDRKFCRYTVFNVYKRNFIINSGLWDFIAFQNWKVDSLHKFDLIWKVRSKKLAHSNACHLLLFKHLCHLFIWREVLLLLRRFLLICASLSSPTAVWNIEDNLTSFSNDLIGKVRTKKLAHSDAFHLLLFKNFAIFLSREKCWLNWTSYKLGFFR